MRKIIDIAVALGIMGGVAFAETDYKALAAIRDIQKGVDNANQIEVLRVRDNATVGGSSVVTQSGLYQSDTNATTTITGYTPAFIGQLLLGGAGTGTNGVWVAKGTTTNDWVQVAP